MSIPYHEYETVIGLEVHAQLLTKSKLFCGDSASFDGEPNTHISAITLGHPGTLPKINRQAVSYAIIMGLACNSEIERRNFFSRKHYFYPDLPKGYQITQHTTPICKGGYVPIRIANAEKKVQLNRIHLEEDAGKSMHDLNSDFTSVDYNRAGVPLIEIVTEPDLHSGEEAYAYLTELRKLLRFLQICDGNMEEGSMRCDANISVRKLGDTNLGTKVEVKNLNSIRNVKRAIEHESSRLIGRLHRGEDIVQETRSFDAANSTTFALRSKEEANDYRYFTDPDLPPFIVSEDWLSSLRSNLPALPEAIVERYISVLHLPEYDARLICDDRETMLYFEQVIQHTGYYKAVANWISGPIKSYLNENGMTISAWPISASTMGKLVSLVEDGRLSFSTASSRLLPSLLADAEQDPLLLATKLNLLQDTDTDEIAKWVDAALEKMPDKVAAYKKGKKGLIGVFVGEVKRLSNGKADPKITNQLLMQKLDS